MKTILLSLSIFCLSPAQSQHFYKDIIGTKETTELIRLYKNNKVRSVQLNSYDADNTKNEGFLVEQVFNPASLKTITRSGDEETSTLVSFINEQGQVIKTVDSSSAMISTTIYTYNPSGNLASITSTSGSASGSFTQTEEHKWEWDGAKILRMLRIKNKLDTSIVSFVLDEKGNVTEERSSRNGVTSEPVYYYWDAQNRLTDVVRFHTKSKRLLPEYMFEYSPGHQVIQKITVPANNSNYLIWRYQYGSDGLKTREAIYTKQKELTGKIDYIYQKG
ncbi:MAG TPA: hypothetical protein VGB56_03370 [Flavisolibacter sp.]